MTMNLPLLVLDFLCLPITLIRLFFIYLFGSCYNVPSLQFLDVMMHATNRFFNQGSKETTIDTISTDVRISINRASRINAEVLYDSVKKSKNDVVTNPDEHNQVKDKNMAMEKVNPTNNNQQDESKIVEKISSSEKPSIFGQRSELQSSFKQIILSTDHSIDDVDIKKLQRMLPMILEQLASKNEVNLNKIDEHIQKELDFLTYEDHDLNDLEDLSPKNQAQKNKNINKNVGLINIDSEQVNPPSSRSGANLDDLDLHTDDSKIFDSMNSLT